MHARGVVEALRSGVPSREAASTMGSAQQPILDRFKQALAQRSAGEAADPVVFEGSFGEGKSHLLNILSFLAQEQGWAASYIVIGAGTPFGKPGVVLRELTTQATVRGHNGRALRELGHLFRPGESDLWRECVAWAAQADVEDRFRALLRLYEGYRDDAEFCVRLLEDIQGAPLLKTEIRKRLRELGEGAGFDMGGSQRADQLAHPRALVFARLLRAMGCEGLVVLVDEVERLGTFSRRQRCAAYGEIAWWWDAAQRADSYILPVFAYHTGFGESVLEKDLAPYGPTPVLGQSVEAWVRGARLLRSNSYRLDSLTDQQYGEIYYRIRDVYQRAYGATVGNPPSRREQTIRQAIRYWITWWDLGRYYPDYQPQISVADVPLDDREIADSDLADGSAEEGGGG